MGTHHFGVYFFLLGYSDSILQIRGADSRGFPRINDHPFLWNGSLALYFAILRVFSCSWGSCRVHGKSALKG